MHVLLTTDTVGGVWTFARELANAFRRGHVDVTLACVGGAPSAAQQRELEASVETVLSHPGRLEWMHEPWTDVDSATAWLQAVAEDVRPDVIHLNQFAYGSARWPAPVVMTAHSCVMTWWQAVHGTPPPSTWNEYGRRVREGIAGADLLVGPSRAFLRALTEQHGRPARATVIQNGVSTGMMQPLRSARERDELVLSVGRLWDQGKNTKVLTHVADRVHAPVYVAGDVQHPHGSRIRTSDLHCLGVLDNEELGQWMRRAAIYVHPARYEPFGLAVLEAAQAGAPLVLSDIATLRELWQGCALFVPPNDAEALAVTLDTLMRDPARRDQLARAAQRRSRRYNASDMARQYLTAYRRASAAGARNVACVS